ncbi:hypothetical protein ACP70R_002189 [Stipagrostis hirtigluma subsp. patula]
MDRYQRVEKPRPEAAAISENEIRITTQGLIRNYVTYATSLLQDFGLKGRAAASAILEMSDLGWLPTTQGASQLSRGGSACRKKSGRWKPMEKRVKEIVLKAMGQAISKTVAIAEIIKKRIPGLHQDTLISSVSITDVWEPIEEGLVPLEMTRHVSMISISLSPKELNKNSPGYQAPLHPEAPLKPQRYQQTQQYQQHQPRQNQVQTIHMDAAVVEAGAEEEGAGVAGVGMVEGMVDMITTKEVMADMDTKAGMDTKVATATREDMATTKVAMGVMVITKVDMEDMKMVVGTTTGTEVVVAVAEEEATGDMVCPGYERGGRGAGGPGGGRGYARGRGRMGGGRGRGNQNY